MVRLKVWQWTVLIVPVVGVGLFLLTAAGFQIHAWGINWIWAIITLLFVGWRWLLVRWTQPALTEVSAAIAAVTEELQAQMASAADQTAATQLATAAIQQILTEARQDPPVWEDWGQFGQRCQQMVTAIARAYYPDVKHPLLSIYIPQAYRLMRGTVDDMAIWMEKLAPALNQVSIGQAYQAYQTYQKLEPSVRKLWRVINWTQWLLNPAAAIARTATQKSGNRANRELLANLGSLLREAALQNLGKQAIALYSGTAYPGLEVSATPSPMAQTQTLQTILAAAEPLEQVEHQPVRIVLVGRTGAGKSSLINTLFLEPIAEVDVLPSTETLQVYHWQAETGEALMLWDSPGYEQVNRPDLKDQVLDATHQADLLLLVTPASDPALEMDANFLHQVKAVVADLPVITVVTQVDRLRPFREWQPPYDWQWGERPKEVAIRSAVQYRLEQLGQVCDRVFPLVTGDPEAGRSPWGVADLSWGLIEAIAPAKQQRLARFLCNQEARIQAAAKIIRDYAFQITTQQGLTMLLKSPVLIYLSNLTTGSPALAYVLAEKIPVEQLPLVIGKLQMAYDLFNLLNTDRSDARNFDLTAIWTLLQTNNASAPQSAWAFGHTITEYWLQTITAAQLQERYHFYLEQAPT